MTSVVAVIAAYEPGDDLIVATKAALGQTSSVIIVDDGSPSLRTAPAGPARMALDECVALGATVLESATNLGIANALNQGVGVALRDGADAVLTLDQDTEIAVDYVARTLEHLRLAATLGLTDVLASPSTINDDVAPFWFAEQGLTLAFEPIQSGLVVSRSVFEKIGLFDESLFIDCVETEFYLRARAAGVHALIVPGAGIRHNLGSPARWVPPRPLRWLLRGRAVGAGLEFSQDAPFRHYYIARNRAVLYRRYGRSEPLWCAVSIAKDTISRGRAMTIGSRRLSRVYLTAAGFGAALRGETGRIPERTLRRAHRGQPAPDVPERRPLIERTPPTLVSVIVPVHNGVDLIDVQLEALAAQTYPGPFEVLIADNGSTDNLRQHVDTHELREQLRLRWIDAGAEPGSSFARNCGAAAAAGDFLAFCDGDDRVYPDWLSEMTMVAALCDAVGGAVETHTVNDPGPQSWRQMLPPEMPYEVPGFLRVSPTCNFGIWAALFERIGGFDPTYDRGAEDADLAIRLQLAGGVLGHAPKALVAYRLRDTLQGIWDQSVMCGEGDARLYSDYRHYGMPRRPWYALVDLVLYLILRNPLLPTALTGVPTGRWLFQAGNLLGRIKGSIYHRVWFV